MAVELIVAPEAEHDIAEAAAWYERQRAGLAEQFLSSLDACIRGIYRTPQMHAVYYQTYRRALLRRFPYAVFYEDTESAVIVYGVFHTSVNPDKWRERLS